MSRPRAEVPAAVLAELGGSDGALRLAVRQRAHSTPRAIVLLLHGICEHAGRLANLEELFVELDCAVFALDLRGHGRSAPVPCARGELYVHVEAFDDYLDDCERWFAHVDACLGERQRGVPRFLIGHSMGGLVAARYATLRRPRLAGLVCLSAAFALQQRLAVRAGALLTALWGGRVYLLADPVTRALALPAMRRGLSSDPAVWTEFAADPLVRMPFTARLVCELERAGRELLNGSERPAVAQLVLHGTRDPLTAPAGSRRWAGSCGRTTLELFEGLHHELHNEAAAERERVFRVLRGWFEARLAELGTDS